MNAFQHIVFSLALVGALVWASQIPAGLPIFAAAILGALLPDVDHEKTKVFRFLLVAVGAAVFATVFSLKKDALFSALAALSSTALLFLAKPRHRGITHSAVAPFVYGGALFLLSRDATLALVGFAAYGSHLVADRFS